MRLVTLVCFALALLVAPLLAQDPVKVAPKNYLLIAESAQVRVLRATLPPGASVAKHAHPAHVGIVLAGGSLQMTTEDGKTTTIEAKADEALLMPAGVHAMSNPGKAPVEVVVIEMKGAPGTGTIPASRPGMKMTRLLQDARVEANRVSVDPSFAEAAGSTHTYDQVVIPLAATDVSLTIGGQTTSMWKRGDVRLIPRGTAHEAKGGKMTGEMIIVSIK